MEKQIFTSSPALSRLPKQFANYSVYTSRCFGNDEKTINLKRLKIDDASRTVEFGPLRFSVHQINATLGYYIS